MSQSPTTSIDINFLNLSTPTTQQVIACFGVLDSVPDFQQIRRAFSKVIERHPRFAQVANKTRTLKWLPTEHFSLDEHLTQVDLGSEPLLNAVSRKFSEQMELSRPLWDFSLFSSSTGGKEVGFLLRFHHSLVDGLAGLEILKCISEMIPRGAVSLREFSSEGLPAEDRAGDLAETADGSEESAGARRFDDHTPPASSSGRIQSSLKLLGELFSGRAQSLLNGDNSSKRVCNGMDFDLHRLRILKQYFSISLNDLLLALVAGAVRAYHLKRSVPFGNPRIVLPVSTRGRHDKFELGNHITGVGVSLPCSEPSAYARVQLTAQKTRMLKESGAIGAYALMARFVAKIPAALQSWACQTLALKTSFICTNVALTPRAKRSLGGAEIREIYGLPALMTGHGVGFAFVSYSKTMFVGLVSDPAIVADAAELLEHLNTELATLELVAGKG